MAPRARVGKSVPMKTLPLLALSLFVSGCASHPALKTALIATGAALVAGAAHGEGGDEREPIGVVRVTEPPCAAKPEACR